MANGSSSRSTWAEQARHGAASREEGVPRGALFHGQGMAWPWAPERRPRRLETKKDRVARADPVFFVQCSAVRRRDLRRTRRLRHYIAEAALEALAAFLALCLALCLATAASATAGEAVEVWAAEAGVP